MTSPWTRWGSVVTKAVPPGGSVASAGLLTAAQVGTAGLGFFANLIGARLLGAADFGVAAMVMAFPALVWSFSAVKPVAITTRYLSVFRGEQRREEFGALSKIGYIIDACSAVTALLVVAVLAGWVAGRVLRIDVPPWLFIAFTATFVPQAVIGTASSVLTALERFSWLAAGLVAGGVVKLAAVVSLLWLGGGVGGFVLGLGAGQAVTGLVLLGLASRAAVKAGMGGWVSARVSAVRSIRSELVGLFSWNYLMASLSGIVAQVPLLLLGRIRSGEEAGYFRLASVLATVAEYPAQAAARVVYPQLSRLHGAAAEPAGVAGRLRRWTLRGGAPLALLLGIGMVVLPVVVPPLFGDAFRPMVPGLRFILVGSAGASLFFWLSPLYYAKVEVARWTRAYLAYAVAVVGLSWPAVDIGGFVAAAAIVGVGRLFFFAFLVFRDPAARRAIHAG